MSVTDIFLGCFAFGLIWSIAAFLLGGFYPHGHGHHFAHGSRGGTHGKLHLPHHAGPKGAVQGGWAEYLVSIHTLAIFLAWAGGAGYLISRHTVMGLAIVLLLAASFGVTGAFILASVLRFLARREFAMNDADYDMIGVLGRVSSAIRSGGTGEMVFVRDGARRIAYVRSEEGNSIPRDQEVVVTSYRRGIAYVRTWAALTSERDSTPLSLQDSGLDAEDASKAHG